MRLKITAGAFIAAMLAGAAAQAENRLFVILNNSDGYGVDQCLASGAECGKAAANFYCRSRTFARALSFHSIDHNDITVAIPTDSLKACHGRYCNGLIAIECSR